MENHIEPPEVVEYRTLDCLMESGQANEVQRERYFLLAHLLVSALGPNSYPEQVGVVPGRVAKHSLVYPEAAWAAGEQCLLLGIHHSFA